VAQLEGTRLAPTPATTRVIATPSQALLEAAAAVFVRRGLVGTSVEEITEEAGFSRGAFYSNFASKEELFLTLIEGRSAEHVADIAQAFQQGDTVQERIANGGRFIDALIARERQWCTLYMEFWAAAMRNPSLRPRLAAQYRALHAGTAQMIQAQADALGISLDTSAEELAGTLIAVFEGYVLQKLIDPQLLPDDFFARLLVRFFGRLAELDRDQQASRPPTHPPAR
jgi:AcrR family transcriptional regulator